MTPENDARWNRIQALFVDDPRRAVGEASEVLRTGVEDAIARLAAAQQHAASQPPGEAATEELRQCFQHLRNVARDLEDIAI